MNTNQHAIAYDEEALTIIADGIRSAILPKLYMMLLTGN